MAYFEVMNSATTNPKTRTVNVSDLAIGRTFGAGWIVFVRGEVLRARRANRPHNERVFSTQEAAILAGARARKRSH